ncbi:hypothetical protein SAY86_007082 [Trapa natans]|uniref:Uncharacterized protein n=1 Tax=Trapa natans TaxID=22666 RepID=A0AAN7LGQ9_TRANT|nr:hypothetical protein SAY86_007082 [Trapa natans]
MFVPQSTSPKGETWGGRELKCGYSLVGEAEALMIRERGTSEVIFEMNSRQLFQ